MQYRLAGLMVVVLVAVTFIGLSSSQSTYLQDHGAVYLSDIDKQEVESALALFANQGRGGAQTVSMYVSTVSQWDLQGPQRVSSLLQGELTRLLDEGRTDCVIGIVYFADSDSVEPPIATANFKGSCGDSMTLELVAVILQSQETNNMIATEPAKDFLLYLINALGGLYGVEGRNDFEDFLGGGSSVFFAEVKSFDGLESASLELKCRDEMMVISNPTIVSQEGRSVLRFELSPVEVATLKLKGCDVP